MKRNYHHLVGKTKKEILKIVKEDQFNDPHSDEWIFYMDKDFFWRKRYLYLLFEGDMVVLSRIVYKRFWEKRNGKYN